MLDEYDWDAYGEFLMDLAEKGEIDPIANGDALLDLQENGFMLKEFIEQ